jgi:hypothetical protein
MSRVESIELELTPSPGLQTEVEADSFTFAFDDARVSVRPKVELTLDEARARLPDELAPLLLVLAAGRGVPKIGFRERSHRLADELNEKGGREIRIGITEYLTTTSDVLIAPPAGYGQELAERGRWVQRDALYRDLLTHLAAAKAAQNPRPDVFNMIERLEQRFGSRKDALAALGLNKRFVEPAVKDQSTFEEDRHAGHPVGASRPPIDSETRNEVIAVGQSLVQAYEDRFL